MWSSRRSRRFTTGCRAATSAICRFWSTRISPGLPRVYGVAWAFVAHTDSAFDETLLAQFLTAYQNIRPLNFGELWALPTTLRVVLIENLRRLSEGVATAMAAREVADLWCERLEKNGATDVDGLFEIMRARGVERAFALQVAARLRSDLDESLTDNERVRDAIQRALERALPDPAGCTDSAAGRTGRKRISA